MQESVVRGAAFYGGVVYIVYVAAYCDVFVVHEEGEVAAFGGQVYGCHAGVVYFAFEVEESVVYFALLSFFLAVFQEQVHGYGAFVYAVYAAVYGIACVVGEGG